MIHLDDNKLEISFPEIHENAGVVIDFQRTSKVPDDDTNHFLPPGLGRFPLRHIEDYDLKNNNHLKERWRYNANVSNRCCMAWLYSF